FGHIGAALSLQRDFAPSQIFLPAREPWRWDSGLTSMRQLNAAGLRGKPLVRGDTLTLGNFMGSPAKAVVLFPTQDIWPRRADDRTLVLRVDLGAHRLLWCNDAGFFAEKKILELSRPEDLRCTIIIRNQHATDFSLLPEFLEAVQPQLIITSSDTFPAEQKLSERTLEDCASRGIRVLDQELTGATVLRFWSDRVDVRPFHDHPSFSITPHQPK
ncbi:MAG TPA: hypothetical protein VLE43_21030, partial [Candidatus Saccharimonadia bacterium]|nr:hypothetical protein [Candidatus Saccharimonadia bacterium]